jgi:Rod binding domain-containing protein
MTVPVVASSVAPAGVAASGTLPGAASGQESRIASAARDFEALFLTKLVDEMFKDTPLGGDGAVYGSLVTDQFGRHLAESGGIGLADILARQMKDAS